jgi:aspartyl-tRNA(Asn)/glutamyl-tRNA(Gln) amidotransferase subunit A
MSERLANLTLSRIRELLVSGEVSVEDLVNYYLGRINNTSSDLNAFVTINERAIAEAREMDQHIQETGQVDFLEGVPVAIKDVIVTRDLRTTAGSKILSNYNPPYNSTVVRKLRQRGAVILGKVNCDEFAMGSSNENSAYGPVRNPHDRGRVPGGSSGGSAAAVAADLCPYSIGTDTGGSIRQPASFCGVVGLKPTYGRVSRYGLIAMTSSFDVAGPLCRSVEDAAIILEALAGLDKKDSTTIDAPVPDYTQNMKGAVTGMRVALPKQFIGQGLDREVRAAILQAIAILTKQGVVVEEVDVPILDYALAVYYVIMPAEVSANLAKFDGVRYGLAAGADDLWDVYKQTRGQGFGWEVKRRILMGTYVLSAGYYDAYYKKALHLQRVIKSKLADLFSQYDAIIGPTTPTTAFKLGEKINDPLAMYLSDIYTVVANIIGAPAISLPVGQDKHNLPIGLQIVSAPLAEEKIFRLAWNLENYRV